jgi:glutaredoxin
MKPILYSTHCPKCNTLKKKMEMSGIDFEVRTDQDEMKSLGVSSAPALVVDGQVMDFIKAVNWVREHEN